MVNIKLIGLLRSSTVAIVTLMLATDISTANPFQVVFCAVEKPPYTFYLFLSYFCHALLSRDAHTASQPAKPAPKHNSFGIKHSIIGSRKPLLSATCLLTSLSHSLYLSSSLQVYSTHSNTFTPPFPSLSCPSNVKSYTSKT